MDREVVSSNLTQSTSWTGSSIGGALKHPFLCLSAFFENLRCGASKIDIGPFLEMLLLDQFASLLKLIGLKLFGYRIIKFSNQNL
jgi:hypothetical protein